MTVYCVVAYSAQVMAPGQDGIGVAHGPRRRTRPLPAVLPRLGPTTHGGFNVYVS